MPKVSAIHEHLTRPVGSNPPALLSPRRAARGQVVEPPEEMADDGGNKRPPGPSCHEAEDAAGHGQEPLVVREAGKVGGKLLRRERACRKFPGKGDGRLGEGEHARRFEPGNRRLEVSFRAACKAQDFGQGELCGRSEPYRAAAGVCLVTGHVGPHIGDSELTRVLEIPDGGKLPDRDELVAPGYLGVVLCFSVLFCVLFLGAWRRATLCA